MTGAKPQELEEAEEIECPFELYKAWLYFLELSSRRTNNGFGHNPLTYPEIEAWSRLTDTEVSYFMVECICTLDHVWMKHQTKPQDQQTTGE